LTKELDDTLEVDPKSGIKREGENFSCPPSGSVVGRWWGEKSRAAKTGLQKGPKWRRVLHTSQRTKRQHLVGWIEVGATRYKNPENTEKLQAEVAQRRWGSRKLPQQNPRKAGVWLGPV